jgi:multiple sugar transport system substrate-binding protein
VVLSRLWSSPYEKDFVKREVVRPFEREHGCTVDFQTLDDDALLKRVQVQQESGKVAADVVIVYVSRMREWVDRGYVEDLTALVESWPERTFAPAFAGMTRFDGAQRFLPIGADDYLLCANRRALDYLPEGAQVGTLSWDAFAAWAAAVARGEGEGKLAVSGVPQKMWIYQAGAVVLAYGGGFPDFGSEGAARAWGLLARLHRDGAFTPTVRTYDSVVPPMKRGEAWLTVAHNARVGEVYASAPAQFVVAPPPRGPAGRGSVVGVSGLAVLKGAPQRALAEAFLAHITRPDVQVTLAKGTGGFIPTVRESASLLGETHRDEIIKQASAVLAEGVLAYIPATENWAAVKQLYDEVLDHVLEGGEIDAARLSGWQRRLDAILEPRDG